MASHIPYFEFTAQCNLSAHGRALHRRLAKYPHHFVTIDGVLHISAELAFALIAFDKAVAKLRQLQKPTDFSTALRSGRNGAPQEGGAHV